MFDSLYLSSKWAEKLKCPNGHPAVGEFQTKDLDQVLAIMRIEEDDSIRANYIFSTDWGYEKYTGTIDAYASCSKCPCAWVPTTTKGSFNYIEPCVSAEFTFKDGRLISVDDIEWETVEEYIAVLHEYDRKHHWPARPFYWELPEWAEHGNYRR